MGDMMKIGIPRSMYFYYFKDLWINFFDFLDIKLVISPETNKEIMDLGVKYSIDEMCLSMKNLIGHIAYLQGKCDYILINNLFDIKILNYNINLNNDETELKGLINIGKTLGLSRKEVIDAYEYACVKSGKIKKSKVLNNLRNLHSEKTKILLVGHPYNIYDKMIGEPIINMLKKLNIEIIYSDLFFVNDEYTKYSKELYWKYSRENISSITKCIDKIDGIIFLSSFPCGPDSLVNELVMRKLNKPYINIIIDDVESSGGIETRIESFVDIVCAI